MRDYYQEALRIVWRGGNWGAALELLNQAQAELVRLRAERDAERQRAEAAERERDHWRGKFQDVEDELIACRKQLREASKRRDTAEASLAAVPVDAIRHILDLAWAVLAVMPAEMDSMPGRVVCASVQKWLAERQQPEVQP